MYKVCFEFGSDRFLLTFREGKHFFQRWQCCTVFWWKPQHRFFCTPHDGLDFDPIGKLADSSNRAVEALGGLGRCVEPPRLFECRIVSRRDISKKIKKIRPDVD